jgi:hypothetical protein
MKIFLKLVGQKDSTQKGKILTTSISGYERK